MVQAGQKPLHRLLPASGLIPQGLGQSNLVFEVQLVAFSARHLVQPVADLPDERQRFLKGDIFVVGTMGSYVFLSRRSADGSEVWTDKLATSTSFLYANSAAMDSSGNIFVAGTTDVSLDGNDHVGGSDIFLTKYNPDGTKTWTEPL